MKSKSQRFLGLLAAFLAACPPLQAQSILTDCAEDSLRGAVSLGGTIQLNCTNAITLSEPLVIDRNTTLFATNATGVLSGGNKSRLFVVAPGVTLTISNIALFSGRHTATNLNDGGIPDTAGAAIYNNGGAVHLYSVFMTNHVVIGYPGSAGGDNNTGGNGEDGGDAAGGAIFNRAGLVLLSNCVVAGSAATGGVGGVGGTGNISDGGDGGKGGAAGGGAIYSQAGTLLLYNNTFTNNHVNGAQGGAAGASSGFGFPGQIGEPGDGVGGAIATDEAYVVASGCTFVNNSATAADGLTGVAGLRNVDGYDGGRGGNASGGAFYNRGMLLMTNCTLVGNSSVGGKGGVGGAGSSAILGTDGGDGGNGGNAAGGAIENTYKATIVNCTFSGNEAAPGEAGVGGAGGGEFGRGGDDGAPGMTLGGGIYNLGDDVSLANTIVTASTGGNFFGRITDLGGNISSDATALFVATGSRVDLNPLLNSLAANGGPTWTMSIGTNSPAFNAGLDIYCPPQDQRGSNRVGQCDIGAYEFIFAGGSTNTNGTNVVTNAVPFFIAIPTNNLVLRWPADATNMTLQTSTNIAGTQWVPVATTPIVRRGFNNLELQKGTNAARFYRLIPVTSTNTTGGDGPPTPHN